MPSSPLSHPLPQTIKALLQPDIHSPKLILATIPTPVATPGTTEHLIHVHSTSPCAGELTWTANISAYASLLPTLSPSSVTAKLQIPCYDLSGTVVTAPPNSPFPPGTEIHTRTSFARSGNARAYTIALTSELARKPSNLSWEEAASVPLSAFTAWQALYVHGGMRCVYALDAKIENEGRTVLINAASGGVGTLLVQFAKAGGIGEVIGVCSAGNAEMVRGLGADEVLDYGREGVEAWGKRTRRKVDLVVDLLGGESLAQAWKVVKKGGRVVSIKEDPNARKPADGVADDVEGKFFVMEPEGWQLEETAKLIEKGQVKPTVDSVWPLRDFEKAFAIVEGGHARGKVIINVSE
ncbi:quinone oxidoreductase-like chloroplastic protein [Botrytis cinerea]